MGVLFCFVLGGISAYFYNYNFVIKIIIYIPRYFKESSTIDV